MPVGKFCWELFEWTRTNVIVHNHYEVAVKLARIGGDAGSESNFLD
jgi:hypothetical protein